VTVSAVARVAIEPATAADLDAIDEIERHSFPVPWPRAAFETELSRHHARLDVARASRAPTRAPTRAPSRAPTRAPDVVGFCNYWLVPEPGGTTGEVQILAIATHPDHRRAGVGAALLARALAEGRAAHCTLATLEVRRGNAPAIALYERAGFRVVHVRRGYYQDNAEDALVMLTEWTP
jgi:ribosomal-protein-alanine N-acetyltransferase